MPKTKTPRDARGTLETDPAAFAARGAAAQRAVDDAIARVSKSGERRDVALDSIAEPPGNPRVHFDEAALKSLADSIAHVGILQPLLVRPNPAGRKSGEDYELVCGNRRFRAAVLAKLQRVPVEIRPLSDEAVLEIQLAENVHRRDLTPLEEARGYARLQKTHGLSADAIADRMSISRSTVYERIRLLELPEEARRAVSDGRLPASTAGLLLRIADPKARDEAARLILAGSPDGGDVRAFDEQGEARDVPVGRPAKGFETIPLSFRAARGLIRRNFLLELGTCGFPIEDAELVPRAGACGACPKRTGNMAGTAEVLGDIRPDVCTDSGCFRSKVDAFWSRRAKAHVEAGGKVLPDARSESVFQKWDDRLSRGQGFVGADEKPNSSSPGSPANGKKTWARILEGSGVELVLARSPGGRIVELFAEKAARGVQARLEGEARKKSGGKAPAAERDPYAAERRAALKKSKARRAVLAGLVERLDDGKTLEAFASPGSSELEDVLAALCAAVVYGTSGDAFGELEIAERVRGAAKKGDAYAARRAYQKKAEAIVAGRELVPALRAALKGAVATALLVERHGNREGARVVIEAALSSVDLKRAALEKNVDEKKPAATKADAKKKPARARKGAR